MSRRQKQILLALVMTVMLTSASISIVQPRQMPVITPTPSCTPAATPEPSATPTPRPTATIPDEVEVHGIDDCIITFFCCEQQSHICNQGYSNDTYESNPYTPYYTCVVDPRVIPLGSIIEVMLDDGSWLLLVAESTSAAVRGRHIQIAVEMHAEALALGRQQQPIIWYEPIN